MQVMTAALTAIPALVVSPSLAQSCSPGALFADGGGVPSMIAEPGPLIVFSSDIQLADMNSDGTPDMIVRLHEILFGPIELIGLSLGNGDGTFQQAVPVTPQVAKDFWVTDYNSDGNQDLLLNDDTGLRLLLGDGAGAFAPEITLNLAHPGFGHETAWTPRAADIDGDGNLDIAVCYPGGVNRILIYWGTRGGIDFPTSTSITGGFPLDLDIIDLDDDGLPDLVSSSRHSSGGFDYQILWNNGGRSFQLGTFHEFGSEISRTSIADLNNDGRPDIVVSTEHSHFSGSYKVLKNNGDRDFVVTDAEPIQTVGLIRTVDIDNDGDIDLVAPGFNEPYVCRNQGDATFGAPEGYPLDGNVFQTELMSVADTNGDGAPDLIFHPVYLNPEPGTPVTVYFNQCPPPAPCPADLASPAGVLDLADINAFIGAFIANDPAADLNSDTVFDLSDITVFVGSFNAGCP